ncbi:MAG: putative rane protein [Phycisphaerales bacterium]|nr:putative rane protein [Phycisphaerales bacterium]MDB5357336.1 putative rane protein [Phycisphaerales bacterium]
MKSDNTPGAGAGNEGSGLTRNARLGLGLFFLYLLFYAGFVALNAFAADMMGRPVAAFGGVNFAIVYGMALIIAAFVLACVYMALCKDPASSGGEEGGR